MARRGSRRSRRTSKRKARATKRKTTRRTSRKFRISKVRSRLRRAVSKVRSRVKTRKVRKPSAIRSRIARATSKARTTFGRRIASFKKPSRRLKTTARISTGLARWRSKFKKAIPRRGKIMGNLPAKWTFPQFKIPKIKIPKISVPKFPGLGLKFKIPKIGFPELKLPGMPRLPDIPGFIKGKVEDVTEPIGGIFEKVAGVAEDWRAKRARKKNIRNIIIGLILLFIAALLWKRK